MLSTGVTATTWMLAVFADATVAVAHVTAQLSGLLRLLLRHFVGFFLTKSFNKFLTFCEENNSTQISKEKRVYM